MFSLLTAQSCRGASLVLGSRSHGCVVSWFRLQQYALHSVVQAVTDNAASVTARLSRSGRENVLLSLTRIQKLIDSEGTPNEWKTALERCAQCIRHMTPNEAVKCCTLLADAGQKSRLIQARVASHLLEQKVYTVELDHIVRLVAANLKLYQKLNYWDKTLIASLVRELNRTNEEVRPPATPRVIFQAAISLTIHLSKRDTFDAGLWSYLQKNIHSCFSHSSTLIDAETTVRFLEALSSARLCDDAVTSVVAHSLLRPEPSQNGGLLGSVSPARLLDAAVALAELDYDDSEWADFIHTFIANMLNAGVRFPPKALGSYLLFRLCIQNDMISGWMERAVQYLAEETSQINDAVTANCWFLPDVLFILEWRRPGYIQHLKEITTVLDRAPQPSYMATPRTFFMPHWERDVQNVLKAMKPGCIRAIQETLGGITIKFPFGVPHMKAILWCLGPFSYYRGTLRLTARVQRMKRMMELKGYKMVPLPYFEWKQMRSLVAKKEYVWRLGREAAQQDLEAGYGALSMTGRGTMSSN